LQLNKDNLLPRRLYEIIRPTVLLRPHIENTQERHSITANIIYDRLLPAPTG